MANTIDYLPFSTASNNTAMDQPTYLGSGARQNGVSPGIADPTLYNKAARQSSVVASMIATFISNAINVSVLDDGSVPNLLTLFQEALTIYVGAPGPASLVHGGPDSGTANAMSIAAQPVITALRAYMEMVVFPAYASVNATSGSPATVTINNTGTGNVTAPLYRNDGSPIQAGDYAAGKALIMISDGSSWFLTKATIPGTAFVHRAPAGDTGTVNNPVLSVVPVLTAVAQDNVVVFAPAYTNTGAMTLNATGTAAPMTRSDGTPMQSGDVLAGQELVVIADGAGNWRLHGFARNEIQRIVLNPTLYVRTDGNDANNGSANTPSSAFATIAAALASSKNQNFATTQLTIVLGIPGTYASPGTVSGLSGPLTIVGSQSNQGAYVIAGSSTGGTMILFSGSAVTLIGLTLQNNGAGNHVVTAASGCSLNLVYVSLQNTASSNGAYIFTGSASSTFVNGGCIFSGNIGSFMAVNGSALSAVQASTTVTFTGTPAFSMAAFLADGSGANIDLLGNVTFSGGATGKQYSITLNASLRLNGATPPGNVAGTTDGYGAVA